MCVCCCFFGTLLKAFNFSSFQSSAEPNIVQTPVLTDPKEKGQSHSQRPGAPRAWPCTQAHTGLREALQEERRQDGPTQAESFCKHTMPFLQLWFPSLSLLILVSDQKKTKRQPTHLRREYLDVYAHITRK